MPTQLIKPVRVQRLEIRCNVGDAIVANLAMNVVFFFERHLDTGVLERAFARALTNLPIFAGRMATVGGPMRIRCHGQGAPFSSVSSVRTLREAIHSVSEDNGSWLVDSVNGVTARWGLSPLSKPMLVGNIITTLNVEVRRGEPAASIAERIHHGVDRFADQHCDLRANQRFLDAGGRWRAARCVTAAFSPDPWNPIVTNLSRFGVYRLQFEGTFTAYCAVLMSLPVAGSAALIEGAHGSGLVFQMALPLSDFQAMSGFAGREFVHRFRCAGDDIPPLHRDIHGCVPVGDGV